MNYVPVSCTPATEKSSFLSLLDCLQTNCTSLIAFVPLAGQFIGPPTHSADLTECFTTAGWKWFYFTPKRLLHTKLPRHHSRPTQWVMTQCGKDRSLRVVATFRGKDEIALISEGVNRSRETCETVLLRVNGSARTATSQQESWSNHVLQTSTQDILQTEDI
jgi:hypothetical protein